jgi:hypothetical protein
MSKKEKLIRKQVQALEARTPRTGLGAGKNQRGDRQLDSTVGGFSRKAGTGEVCSAAGSETPGANLKQEPKHWWQPKWNQIKLENLQRIRSKKNKRQNLFSHKKSS